MAATFVAIERRRAMRRERVFKDRFNPLENLHEREVRDRYRFFPETITFICRILHGNLHHPTLRSAALPTLLQVLVALRFYACGSYQSVIGDTLNLSKSTICRCIRVVSLALEAVAGQFIQFPTRNEEVDVKRRFFQIAGFPNVIGCIDGCLIRIKKPSHNTHEYISRKGYPAINVQFTCLPDHRFSSLVAKWPGSCHDSRIFNESELATYISQDHGILLGDSGYPNRPYLLTTILGPRGRAEENYNSAHCQTRVKIEQAFGILKNRFGCLLMGIRMTPERSVTVITAVSVLHNIAIMHRDNFEALEINEEMDAQVHPAANDAPAGLATRMHYVNSYFS